MQDFFLGNVRKRVKSIKYIGDYKKFLQKFDINVIVLSVITRSITAGSFISAIETQVNL